MDARTPRTSTIRAPGARMTAAADDRGRPPGAPGRATVAAALVAVTVLAWVLLFVLAGTDCGSDADPPSAADRATVGCLDARTDGGWGDLRRVAGVLTFPGLAMLAAVVGTVAVRRRRPWTLATHPVVAVALLVTYAALGHVTVTPGTVRLLDARLEPVGCPAGASGPCDDDARLVLDVRGDVDVGLRLTRDRPAPRTRAEVDASIRAPIEPTYLPDAVGVRESRADTREPIPVSTTCGPGGRPSPCVR